MSVMTVERGLAPGPAKPLKMPEGIALSATLHVGLFALILIGLPHLFHTPPPEETPIAVELVTIAPETKATHPNPYRPRPEAKPEAAAAPPSPKPEPKPEPPIPVPEPPASAAAPSPAPPPPKPEPKEAAPPPPPPPKPVEVQAPQPPVPHQEPKKTDPAAFDKLVKNLEHKKSNPAAFDKLVKNLEEKKPEPADFDSLLKNLTKQQTADAPDAPPRPHRLAATAAPSSQPKAPLGSQLTASELDALASQVMQQLYPCWNIPAGARDAKDLQVQVRALVKPDGTVTQATIVSVGSNDPLYRAAAESARRTFFNPRCTPLKLPGDKYEIWKELDVTFNPKDIL